ncbi:MAG: flagellar biosynthesis anti-sigma factor FlgM [Syntrophomonadaceae bacterium]|nr:flagellar biosynthesis anti-sigma factor FlgM [Syntrophomonadaceae bacterium]MDD3024416.1 flagellar biosynthesis anti-sigma factor FlgM [Syntrophomonadaceae bacterium]
MIISKTQLQNVLKIYDKGSSKIDKTQAGKAVAKNDQLALSQESKFTQRLMQAIKQADDIRIDKVSALEEQISSGTYTICDDEVAEKMIERAIVDRFV